MLGLIFTEFSDLVESEFSPEMLDDIIKEAGPLDSEGAYTAVGHYSHKEILALVTALSNQSGVSVQDLVCTFGEHLFKRFVQLYPEFFEEVDNSFDFLTHVEDHIHVEVKKLYPNARLPSFDISINSPCKMTMVYKSSRPFEDLAIGLIKGCGSYFREELSISIDEVASQKHSATVFTIEMQSK